MGSALDRRERSIRLSSESRGWRVGRKFRRTLVAVLRLRCPRVSRAMLCWQRAVALWAYYEYWYFLVCSLSAKGRKWTASSERWTPPKFACFSVRGRPWLSLPFPTVPAAGNSTPAGGGAPRHPPSPYTYSYDAPSPFLRPFGRSRLCSGSNPLPAHPRLCRALSSRELNRSSPSRNASS